MALNIVDIDRMRELFQEFAEVLPPDKMAIAEIVRHELWASRLISRRILCDRVASMVHPLVDVDGDAVRVLLDEMERTGDIIVGFRGVIAAAPLRVVSSGGGRYRLFGSLPSHSLKEYFASVDVLGTVREVCAASEDAISDLLNNHGGIQLSAERWAGFDRVLPAGPAWLEQLDERLDNEACNPGIFDCEVNDTWMVYRPTAASSKKKSPWKKTTADEKNRLWRGWSLYGRPIHLWTAGDSPTVSRSLRLTSDEAARTVFTLSSQAGMPIRFQADIMGTFVVLQLDEFLPMAEYRYLMTIGEMQDTGGAQRVFKIPLEVWSDVEATLRKRLSVSMESTGK